MKFYVGIDFGTSGARIALIDAAATLWFQTSVPFGAETATHWAASWQTALFRLLDSLPVDYRRQVEAIAINGTSSTVLLCNAGGDAIASPLLYNDTQALSALEPLQQFFAQERYSQARGRSTVLSATSSLVKLCWWKQQPFFHQARYFMHQADWLASLLHGRLGISDYHNSLKLGYDVGQLCYPDWMEDLGVMPLLPRVVAPGTPIGTVTPSVAARLGLSPDCLVCAGTTDSIAAFLASGAQTPGEAVTSLGSTVVLKLLSRIPVEHEQYGIYSHRLDDLWLVGGASNTGGAVLQQFFTPAELERLSSEIVCDRASSLDYYPLTQPGERFPVNDPHLKPRLEPRPAAAVDFLHGLLESMARIEAMGYRMLQELGATPLTRVYTAGGGATNAVWTTIRSRHLTVPVLPSAQTEAAYGTALLALRRGMRIPE
jgi:xylulokinase